MYKILLKSCCTFVSVAGDVATEFKWYCLTRNPRVTFKGHVDSEAIQVDETFVKIHAEDDNNTDDTDFDFPPASQPRHGLDTNTNMDLLLDMDQNTWASQGFDFLNRRPLRSQQPRLTNREFNRGSCFF